MRISNWGAAILASVLATMASAEKHAFVLGNAAYEDLSVLQNTLDDARAYADTFADLGYSVTSHSDLGLDEMEDAIATFVAGVNPGDEVVFVFSGHGWSNGSVNFLIPTDAPAQGSDRKLARNSIALRNGSDGVLDDLERSGAGLTVAVIDACRNNPFKPKPGTKSAAGMTRGLAPVTAPQGSFVIFSAGEGQEALDRLPGDPADQKLSVFTRAFLPHLKSGIYLEDATSKAQVETAAMARQVGGHLQHPAYYDQTLGDTCLIGQCDVTPVVQQVQPVQPVQQVQPKGICQTLYEEARASNDCFTYEGYLNDCRDHAFFSIGKRAYAKSCPVQVNASSSVRDGLKLSFDVPFEGTVKDWGLSYQFTTDCENDHWIGVRSPNKGAIVMNRGKNRCTGQPASFAGEATEAAKHFVGKSAEGTWSFTMKDLDANAHSGRLDAVRMTLALEQGGTRSDFTFDLPGLPLEVPTEVVAAAAPKPVAPKVQVTPKPLPKATVTPKPPTGKKANTLTLVSWGGDYTRAQELAYVEPYKAKNPGVSVSFNNRAYDAAYLLRDMNRTRDIAWDLIDVLAFDAIRMCDEGLVEEIDHNTMLALSTEGASALDDFGATVVSKCFVPQIAFSKVLAYGTRRFPGAKPTAFCDIFDTQRFPGKRALQSTARENLEWALLCDGVAPDQVYSVLGSTAGTKRALAKLDTIARDVIWWEAGEEPIHLLQDGEVVMATAWDGRIFEAQDFDSKTITKIWDMQMLDFDGWVLPANLPVDRRARAMDFLFHTTDPQSLADQAQYAPYGPARASSAPLIGQHERYGVDMKKHVPTGPGNADTAFVPDFEFWITHEVRLTEAFDRWRGF